MGFKILHRPCDRCGSSDGRCYNADGSSKCFSCNTFFPGNGDIDMQTTIVKNTSSVVDWLKAQQALATETFKPFPERCLSTLTASHYSTLDMGGIVVYGYYSASDPHLPVAAKLRYPDKRFSVVGDWNNAALFGQHLFAAGGKYVTIVEGEFDALSAYQMMGSKYPAVSVRNGASGALKDCKAAYEWLNSFDNIVLCLDGDEAGQKAAVDIAQLFGGKCKIVKHAAGYKDASDYLQKGQDKLFMQHWWDAERYIPDGIISGDTLWEEVNSPIEQAPVQYPWKGLNNITYGVRTGELVTITAGSGLGKSQFVRELAHFIIKNTEVNVGMLMLEESTRKTGLSLMSLEANKTLHLPTTVSTEAERKQAFDATVGSGRVFMFDHFGSTDIDNIVSRVRYMAKGLDCRYIFLDHISIIVSAQSNGDERKAIDECMTKLRMLVAESDISLILVSHLKRKEGVGHEEGSSTSLSQLRGSASIAQLSDLVIGLERDGQADDPIEKNTTYVRVLKNRFSGETGLCCKLFYDNVTGRSVEIND